MEFVEDYKRKITQHVTKINDILENYKDFLKIQSQDNEDFTFMRKYLEEFITIFQTKITTDENDMYLKLLTFFYLIIQFLTKTPFYLYLYENDYNKWKKLFEFTSLNNAIETWRSLSVFVGKFEAPILLSDVLEILIKGIKIKLSQKFLIDQNQILLLKKILELVYNTFTLQINQYNAVQLAK